MLSTMLVLFSWTDSVPNIVSRVLRAEQHQREREKERKKEKPWVITVITRHPQ